MLKLRIKLCGNKKKKCFQFLVMLNRSKRDGKAFFKIGYYNPFRKILKIDFKTLKNLIKNGLQITKSLKTFFCRLNIFS